MMKNPTYKSQSFNKKTAYIYVIRKYVVASSIQNAIKKDKATPVHDCWLSDGSTNLMHANELDK